MYLHSNAAKVATVAALTSLSGLANAGGFGLNEHGASGLGNAYAGSAAVAVDSSTLWFNPAGMLQLTGSEAMVAAHAISSNTSITNEGTTLNTALGGGLVSGDPVGENDGVTPIPNVYFVSQFNDEIAYGIGLDIPFGSGSEYGDQWFGRYSATESSIAIVDINPSVAYRVSDKFHIGGGISLQIASATLDNAVDSGAVCFAANADDLAPCINAGLTPGNLATDSSAGIEGDSTGIGFNLGVMFIPADHTRIGVSYRSEVNHTLEGDGSFDNSPEFQALLDASQSPAFVTGPGQTDITTPASTQVSIAHTLQQFDRLQLLADVTYTQWTAFDQLLIEFDNPAQADVLQVQDWEDVFRLSAGVNFQYSPKVILRAGLAFDESPIPGPSRRTPRIPGNDRTWYSVGLGYKATDTFSFDLGYTRIALDDTPIDNSFPESLGATTVRGTIESSVDIFSAQLNWKF